MIESAVVRLGPGDENVSTKLLRNALVHYFDEKKEKQSSSSPTITPTTKDDNLENCNAFTIVNKYFSANVLLEEIGSTSKNDDNSTTTATTTTKEDGIILVFDALHSNPDRSSNGLGRGGGGHLHSGGSSFDALDLAHQQAEDRHTCGDLLRLCVGVSLTSDLSAEELRGKNHEQEYSRRILWCLDRGYEYVEADLSQEGQLQGHDERDKDGFARIVEAIQGTVWSSAVMSQTKTQQLKETYKEDTNALIAGGSSEEAKQQEQEQEQENLYEPPDPSKFGLPTTTRTTINADNTDAGLLIVDPDSINSNSKVSPEDQEEIAQAEQLFDHMEGALKEATRIREASKSGIMSDEERRERAGDAAMALVNLMSQLGYDDDESGAEDSSDNEDSGIVKD